MNSVYSQSLSPSCIDKSPHICHIRLEDPICFFRGYSTHILSPCCTYVPLISLRHLQCTSFLFGGGRPPRPPLYSKAFRVFALRPPQSRIPALRGVPRLTLRPWSAASSVSVLSLRASRTSFSGNFLSLTCAVPCGRGQSLHFERRVATLTTSGFFTSAAGRAGRFHNVLCRMLVLCQIGRREGHIQPFFGPSWTLCTISSVSNVIESMDTTSGPIFLDTWPLRFVRQGGGLHQHFPLKTLVCLKPAFHKNSLDDLNDPPLAYCLG
ncbi:hypothetical protein R3P38DRAFT_982884 [Favolaschia claudopus]|uniref:Uncharacterized protein n=1 Tax=Favolaschia claudopus TaxID=2862362 RepID=A0AAV9YYH1_9AGAR